MPGLQKANEPFATNECHHLLYNKWWHLIFLSTDKSLFYFLFKIFKFLRCEQFSHPEKERGKLAHNEQTKPEAVHRRSFFRFVHSRKLLLLTCSKSAPLHQKGFLFGE